VSLGGAEERIERGEDSGVLVEGITVDPQGNKAHMMTIMEPFHLPQIPTSGKCLRLCFVILSFAVDLRENFPY
jgi:hypothetical protein